MHMFENVSEKSLFAMGTIFIITQILYNKIWTMNEDGL